MPSKLKSKNNKKKISSKRISRRKHSSIKSFCRSKLSKKIAINLREMKSGNKRIKSPKQAIAISYSQIKKKYPKCVKSLKRKSK
jgi:hypothetical protein